MGACGGGGEEEGEGGLGEVEGSFPIIWEACWYKFANECARGEQSRGTRAHSHIPRITGIQHLLGQFEEWLPHK